MATPVGMMRRQAARRARQADRKIGRDLGDLAASGAISISRLAPTSATTSLPSLPCARCPRAFSAPWRPRSFRRCLSTLDTMPGKGLGDIDLVGLIHRTSPTGSLEVADQRGAILAVLAADA